MGTLGDGRDGGEAHVLGVVHGEVVQVEGQDGEHEHAQPQPVVRHLEQRPHDVDDQHDGEGVARVVEVVGAEGEGLQPVRLLLVRDVQDLVQQQRHRRQREPEPRRPRHQDAGQQNRQQRA